MKQSILCRYFLPCAICCLHFLLKWRSKSTRKSFFPFRWAFKIIDFRNSFRAWRYLGFLINHYLTQSYSLDQILRNVADFLPILCIVYKEGINFIFFKRINFADLRFCDICIIFLHFFCVKQTFVNKMNFLSLQAQRLNILFPLKNAFYAMDR